MDCFEQEKIKEENEAKDIESPDQKINLNEEKVIKITEERTENKLLIKDEDDKKKKFIEKKIELKIETVEVKSDEQKADKKPQDKASEDVVEKMINECKEKASAGHRERKRKRRNEGNRLKKIKHKIGTSDIDMSYLKKSKRHSRDDDSDLEEGEICERKAKKYNTSSLTEDYYEEDYKKDFSKKEYDSCMDPAIDIKQEFQPLLAVYYCDICNLTLNSHASYQSHILGKKHKKNLGAKSVAQVAESHVSTESTSKQGADFVKLFKSCSLPDPSKAGFYCNICNSHSNSSSMWEAHINGKRHISNLKKAPGTAPSKSRSVSAPPGTVARLHLKLKNVFEPVVGLGQIREIQSLDIDSVSYTCFLCGGISICESEIVDHILFTKHREKYLEKVSYPGFGALRSCQMSVRDSVIAELCERVEDEQGRGEPEVHYAKISSLDLARIYTPSSISSSSNNKTKL